MNKLWQSKENLTIKGKLRSLINTTDLYKATTKSFDNEPDGGQDQNQNTDMIKKNKEPIKLNIDGVSREIKIEDWELKIWDSSFYFSFDDFWNVENTGLKIADYKIQKDKSLVIYTDVWIYKLWLEELKSLYNDEELTIVDSNWNTTLHISSSYQTIEYWWEEISHKRKTISYGNKEFYCYGWVLNKDDEYAYIDDIKYKWDSLIIVLSDKTEYKVKIRSLNNGDIIAKSKNNKEIRFSIQPKWEILWKETAFNLKTKQLTIWDKSFFLDSLKLDNTFSFNSGNLSLSDSNGELLFNNQNLEDLYSWKKDRIWDNKNCAYFSWDKESFPTIEDTISWKTNTIKDSIWNINIPISIDITNNRIGQGKTESEVYSFKYPKNIKNNCKQNNINTPNTLSIQNYKYIETNGYEKKVTYIALWWERFPISWVKEWDNVSIDKDWLKINNKVIMNTEQLAKQLTTFRWEYVSFRDSWYTVESTDKQQYTLTNLMDDASIEIKKIFKDRPMIENLLLKNIEEFKIKILEINNPIELINLIEKQKKQLKKIIESKQITEWDKVIEKFEWKTVTKKVLNKTQIEFLIDTFKDLSAVSMFGIKNQEELKKSFLLQNETK